MRLQDPGKLDSETMFGNRISSENQTSKPVALFWEAIRQYLLTNRTTIRILPTNSS